MRKTIVIMALTSFLVTTGLSQNKPVAEVERVRIEYQGDSVHARKLTVTSVIPMNIDMAWENVQTPELLQFVAKGMIKFKPVDEDLPKQWDTGTTYRVKMRIFGFIPFGGIHYLYISTLDSANYLISTREWDKSANVWNHEVKMIALGTDSIFYEDSIVIYGGAKTGFITAFAKIFYEHRQKRWQIVAKENHEFGK